MGAESSKLELRFAGNNVSPDVVKPSEVAELLVGFEKAILSEIKDRHPEFDTNQIFLVFSQIKNESLGLEFLPKTIQDVIVSTFTIISSSFQTGDFTQLNNDTISELRTLTKFSKRHNCAGYFKLNGQDISSFTPSTEIPLNKNPIIKGDIKIFGRVMDAGGKNPNVHLRISDSNQEFIFTTTESHAKELAHKLYEKVYLFGSAKWDAITLEVKEFRIKEILEYSSGKTLKAINQLRDITSGYWDNFNTNDDINNQLLRD